MFHDCTKLERAAIPTTITSIGNQAFRGCVALTMDVNELLPEGLCGSLYRSFYNCKNLYGDVILPAGVTSIAGNFPQSKITSFRTAEGSKLEVIGEKNGWAEDNEFNKCLLITNIIFRDTIKTFYGKNDHFRGCPILVNVTLPGITCPSDHVVSGGGGSWRSTFRDSPMITNSIVIPDDVEVLEQTFDGAKKISGVTLGKGIKLIGNFTTGESAFTDNEALKFVDMSAPTNMTEIGQYNFSSCKSITELVIPDTVTNIGKSAFVNCHSLTNLVMPANIGVSLGEQTFKNVGKNSYCDIWWRGAPTVPMTGLGTSKSVMGYDEGKSNRVTHYFRIDDYDYWTSWANANADYITLPARSKRSVGTWKDHNNKTHNIKWWFDRKGFVLIYK
jgi:hypothetical protein